jgi:hypothetical protein
MLGTPRSVSERGAPALPAADAALLDGRADARCGLMLCCSLKPAPGGADTR